MFWLSPCPRYSQICMTSILEWSKINCNYINTKQMNDFIINIRNHIFHSYHHFQDIDSRKVERYVLYWSWPLEWVVVKCKYAKWRPIYEFYSMSVIGLAFSLGRTDGRTDGRTKERMEGHAETDGQIVRGAPATGRHMRTTTSTSCSVAVSTLMPQRRLCNWNKITCLLLNCVKLTSWTAQKRCFCGMWDSESSGFRHSWLVDR